MIDAAIRRTRVRLHLRELERKDAPATFTVNALTDASTGTGTVGDLRYCVSRANDEVNYPGSDLIVFDGGIFASPRTIVLTGGELLLTSPVTIQGTTKSNVTINGNGSGRIFEIAGSGSYAVVLSRLTLTNGRTTGITATDGGGAVALDDQDVSITDCNLTGNTSEAEGGAVTVRDADGKLTIADCILSKNSSTGTNFPQVGSGGAIALAAPATLSIQRSTISGNTASAAGGGIYCYLGGTLTLLDSTIDGNSAAGSGGGIYFFGATGAIDVCNSTISSNKSGQNGGAIELNTFNALLTVRNSTIAANTAFAYGGGIDRTGGSGEMTFTSSIVAGNAAGADADISLYPAGSVIGNNNVLGVVDPAVFTISGTGNQFGSPTAPLNAKLGPLADNGGPTRTHALLAGSPALGTGNNVAGLANDQRGIGFARTLSGKTDVGAFQTQPPKVNALTIGDGTIQRSMVQSLTVNFSASVTLPANPSSAFQLERIGSGGPTGIVSISLAQAGSFVTLSFADAVFAPDVLPGHTRSLIDGFYKLTIFAASVSGPGGALDGNGDGVGGDNYVLVGDANTKLFRLFGDSDGNGVVDQVDFIAMRNAFNNGPSAVFDADGDGQVNQADFIRFRNNFNLTP